MNTEYQVFLDMDGVLVDFEGGFQTLFGMSPEESNKKIGKDKTANLFLDRGSSYWVNLPPLQSLSLEL